MKSSNAVNILLLTLCLTLALAAPGLAAFDYVPSGARPVAMGSAQVALVRDSQSVFWNPAGLALQSGYSAGSSYFRQFGMAELDYTSIHGAAATPWGTIGLGYVGHGDALYGETSFSLSYARPMFNQRLLLGATVRSMQLSIAEYGDDQTLGVDVAVLTHLDQRLWLGFVATNLNAPTIGQSDEAIPQIISAGLAYHLLDTVWLTGDLRKDIEQPLQACAGIEYSPIDLLTLRLGGHNEPAQFSAGFGVRGPDVLRALQLDYAFQTHETLGVTHHFSVSFSPGRSSPPPPAESHRDTPPDPQIESPPATLEPINLNQADSDDLQEIPGIGPKLADEIITYRAQNGPFTSVDQLQHVKGIGEKMLNKIKPYLFVE